MVYCLRFTVGYFYELLTISVTNSLIKCEFPFRNPHFFEYHSLYFPPKLHDTLSHHGVGNFHEAGNVSTLHIVDVTISLGTILL